MILLINSKTTIDIFCANQFYYMKLQMYKNKLEIESAPFLFRLSIVESVPTFKFAYCT